MNAWADLETALDPEPLFLVEKPDGRKTLSEDKRAAMLVKLVHTLAPGVEIAHVRNEGNYNHARAKTLGVVAGFGDFILTWKPRATAFIELKGYTAAGRPGVLSNAQIDWANRKYMQGFPVACFFSPEKALEWLRDQGAPVRQATFENGPDSVRSAARSSTRQKD